MKIMNRYARKNRKQPTLAELRLKKRLQRWQIFFRSQRPFGRYVVDFLLITRRVVVEVDGDYHLSEKQITYDNRRTAFLESQGLTVVRFTNDQVLNKELEVRDKILTYPELYSKDDLSIKQQYPTSYADY